MRGVQTEEAKERSVDALARLAVCEVCSLRRLSRHNMSLHPACLVSRLPALEARLQELCHTAVPLHPVPSFPLDLIEGSHASLSSLCRCIQNARGLSLKEAETLVLEKAKRTPYGVIRTNTDLCESQDELCYWVWEAEETTQPTCILAERKLLGTTIRKLYFVIQHIKRITEASGSEAAGIQAALDDYQTANEKWTAYRQRFCKRSREEERTTEVKKPKITPRISLEGTSLLRYFSAASKDPNAVLAPLPLFNHFLSKQPPKPFALPVESPVPGGDWQHYLKCEIRTLKPPSKVLVSLYGTPLQFQIHRPRQSIEGRLSRNPFVKYAWVDYEAESEQVRGT